MHPATVVVIPGIPPELAILILLILTLIPFTFVFVFLSAWANWKSYESKRRALVFLHGLLATCVIIGCYLSSQKSTHRLESEIVGEQLDELGFMMKVHFNDTGGYPSGTHSEIVEILSEFGPVFQRTEERGFRVDENGVLHDVWGTPVRFVSTENEGRVDSAGPDKRFDTRDDVTSQRESASSGSQPPAATGQKVFSE